MVPSDALTVATTTFKNTFQDIQVDFFNYGQAIFFGLLTISIVLKALEYAWTKDITESLPDWIRELLGAGFFWTVMQNLSWLSSLPDSANAIGTKYVVGIDPSSIILKGVLMTNTIMKPLNEAGLLKAGAAMLIGIGCCFIIMFCLINIAMNVAVTAICTQGIISMSPIFLAAGAFKQSSPIARNAIDAVIGNAVKLMGYYIVIYSGNKALEAMSGQISGTFDSSTQSFDQYSYIIAVVALFYAVAKTFPDQLAKLVTGVIQENRGINAMAASMAAVSVAAKAMPYIGAGLAASKAFKPLGYVAGATMANALANYREISATNPGGSMMSKAGAALKQAATTAGGATSSNITDKFRDLATRATGASGNKVSSVAERINKATNSTKAQTQANQNK